MSNTFMGFKTVSGEPDDYRCEDCEYLNLATLWCKPPRGKEKQKTLKSEVCDEFKLNVPGQKQAQRTMLPGMEAFEPKKPECCEEGKCGSCKGGCRH